MENALPRVIVMTQVTPDFRVGPVETETRDDGSTIRFLVCEELLDGRWEGFVTIIEDTRVFCLECGTHTSVCRCRTKGRPFVTSNNIETDRAIRRMEAAGLSGDEAQRAAALDLAIRRTMQEP